MLSLVTIVINHYGAEIGLSRTIKLLLCSANSVNETRPRFFINDATASSSDCDIYINLPLSSITPNAKLINYFLYNYK